MSLLTEAPGPYDFLASLRLACEQSGDDFARLFEASWSHHYVFKGPDYLMLGAAHPARPDAWLVLWAEMFPKPANPLEAVARFIGFMPEHRPYIAWARQLKKRDKLVYYSTDRLLKLTAHRR